LSEAGEAFKTIGRTVGGVGLGLTYVNGVFLQQLQHLLQMTYITEDTRVQVQELLFGV